MANQQVVRARKVAERCDIRTQVRKSENKLHIFKLALSHRLIIRLPINTLSFIC